jgi:60S ribosomal protein uL30
MSTKPITTVPQPEKVMKRKLAKTARGKFLLKKTRAHLKRKKDKDREMVRRYFKYRKFFDRKEKKAAQKRWLAGLRRDYYVEAEPRVAFVVRIRGINDMPPKPKKILQLLRLRQIWMGVFVRLNKATLNMLRLVSPWITWGYPSRIMIRKIMYKRAFLKFRGQRKRVTNDLIERGLGRHNIICMEDLIFQLTACGKRFKEVSHFLWPFRMRAPKGGIKAKRRHFVEGGDFGNREFLINPFVQRML